MLIQHFTAVFKNLGRSYDWVFCFLSKFLSFLVDRGIFFVFCGFWGFSFPHQAWCWSSFLVFLLTWKVWLNERVICHCFSRACDNFIPRLCWMFCDIWSRVWVPNFLSPFRLVILFRYTALSSFVWNPRTSLTLVARSNLTMAFAKAWIWRKAWTFHRKFELVLKFEDAPLPSFFLFFSLSPCLSSFLYFSFLTFGCCMSFVFHCMKSTPL